MADVESTTSIRIHQIAQSAALQQQQAHHLIGDFYINDKLRKSNPIKIKVQLNETGILLKREVNKKNTQSQQELIRLNDIVGCGYGQCSYKTNESSTNNDIDAHLIILAYVRQEKPLRRIRIYRSLKFKSLPTYEENLKYTQYWHDAIKFNKRINSCLDDGKPLLIILNPKSGSGYGRQIFQNKIAPILQEAGVLYELVVTTHANFARDLIRQAKDLAQRYSGIVVASGDGLLFEVLNGIMERLDWQILVSKLPVGIIPCGSGNGLAKSIAHFYNEPYEPQPIINATLTCISGKTSPMDVVLVEQNKAGKYYRMYSFLSIGWGLVADIDIESERWRSIGAQRFKLWAVYRLLDLKIYKGRISYLPINGKIQNHISNTTISLSQLTNHLQSRQQDCPTTDVNQLVEFITDDDNYDTASNTSCTDSWHSCLSQKIYHSVHNTATNNTIHQDDNTNKMETINGEIKGQHLHATIPPLSRPVPDTWHSEEGEFVLVQAAYTSHLATDCHFAPDAKLNDGIIYLVIIKSGIPRTQLLYFLNSMATGTHLSNSYSSHVQVIPVTAFRLEPFDTNGIMTVDGERVACAPLQAEIFPGLINVMTPNV